MERLDLRENTDGALNAVQAKINEIVDWINKQDRIYFYKVDTTVELTAEEIVDKLRKLQS